MNVKRKYINPKTGKIRESNLTPRQASMHGFVPYEEPEVAKIVKTKPEPGIDVLKESPVEEKEEITEVVVPKKTRKKRSPNKPKA